MSFHKELNIKNEIIDDIIERKSNGVSPLLEKKRAASRYNIIRNFHDLMYFGSLPYLFFVYSKRNSGRQIYNIFAGAYIATYLGLGYLKTIQYEKTKQLLAADDNNFEDKVAFHVSFVRDKYDPYEKLPKN